MSDQPKPTGEWTDRDVLDLGLPYDNIDLQSAAQIAEAHNAALDKAKSGGWLSEEALDEYAKVEQEVLQLREQLAAEREPGI